MKIKLKPIAEQSIVITGASSGIGLATALAASALGARLTLVARSEMALTAIADEIKAAGGQAAWEVADVADRAALQRAADRAIDRYGGIDTWVRTRTRAGAGRRNAWIEWPGPCPGARTGRPHAGRTPRPAPAATQHAHVVRGARRSLRHPRRSPPGGRRPRRQRRRRAHRSGRGHTRRRWPAHPPAVALTTAAKGRTA